MKSLPRSKIFWILVVIAAIVVIARAMLPYWVHDYVNRKLDEMPDYDGHIADVDIHLWRGAYSLRDAEIVKTTGKVPVPFFAAPAVDLSVEWKALFDGALVGEIHFERPRMNFVNAPSKANSQVGIDQPWTQKIRELFPLKINRFTVRDGEIHYRDFHRSPKVDVEIDQVRMVATNLTNSRKLSESLAADIEIKGRPLREGNLEAKVKIDPYARKPTFNTRLEFEEVSLVKLNDFAKAYAGITFESGTLKLATRMDAKNGRFNGYVEPVFDKMEIFDPEEDIENPIDFIWQGIVGGLTSIIRNHPKDRFGTRVPFSGSFEDPKAAVLETVFNVFRNALVKAFEGKLESDPDTPQLDKGEEKGEIESEG